MLPISNNNFFTSKQPTCPFSKKAIRSMQKTMNRPFTGRNGNDSQVMVVVDRPTRDGE